MKAKSKPAAPEGAGAETPASVTPATAPEAPPADAFDGGFNGADPAAFDHDGDGKPGGSLPDDAVPVSLTTGIEGLGQAQEAVFVTRERAAALVALGYGQEATPEDVALTVEKRREAHAVDLIVAEDEGAAVDPQAEPAPDRVGVVMLRSVDGFAAAGTVGRVNPERRDQLVAAALARDAAPDELAAAEPRIPVLD